MMAAALRFLWALAFFAGCLAIIGTGLYVWLSVMIAITQSLGWVAGVVALGLTTVCLIRFGDIIARPWDIWRELYHLVDRDIETRFARKA